jgi:hypothetical protein
MVVGLASGILADADGEYRDSGQRLSVNCSSTFGQAPAVAAPALFARGTLVLGWRQPVRFGGAVERC